MELSNLSLAPGPNENRRGYINETTPTPSYWAHAGYITFCKKREIQLKLSNITIIFNNCAFTEMKLFSARLIVFSN